MKELTMREVILMTVMALFGLIMTVNAVMIGVDAFSCLMTFIGLFGMVITVGFLTDDEEEEESY